MTIVPFNIPAKHRGWSRPARWRIRPLVCVRLDLGIAWYDWVLIDTTGRSRDILTAPVDKVFAIAVTQIAEIRRRR